MNITGIMTCVGPLYQSYLLRSLPVWLDTLDSLTIATDKPMHLGNASNLHVVVTPAFTEDGAYLNKGKALNVAYQAASPTDWALSIDADIVPPKDWRLLTERMARPDSINGAYRYDEQGNRLDQLLPFTPKGYFQLWHVNDPRFDEMLRLRVEQCKGGGPFNPDYPHAAHYDTEFYEQWPEGSRNNLGFKVTHLGERSKNWFGVGVDPALTHRVLKFLKLSKA